MDRNVMRTRISTPKPQPFREMNISSIHTPVAHTSATWFLAPNSDPNTRKTSKATSKEFHYFMGSDSTDPDTATLMPEISLRSSGGRVEVLWNKGGQEGFEIQKNSGNGQWTFLAIDTRPKHIDTTRMPATSAEWKYRAIYSNDAQRIGQWSNVAEIIVAG